MLERTRIGSQPRWPDESCELASHPLGAAPGATSRQRAFECPTMRAMPPEIHPNRTLWLLSLAHLVNHAQAVLLPIVYLRIIDEFGVTAETIALLAAAGAFASGAVQLSYAKLTRMISRRKLLAAGGILFGGGFAAQAVAP